MRFAYLNHITIDKSSNVPVYIQIRDALRTFIQEGILKPGVKLPSTRALAKYLAVHRQTVVAGVDELIAEGWLVTRGRKGTFVRQELPVVRAVRLGGYRKYPNAVNFPYKKGVALFYNSSSLHGFDDGFPDSRETPMKELGKAYARTLVEKSRRNLLSRISDPLGNGFLREQLTVEFNVHRGLSIDSSNVLITQGTQMSLFSIASLLLDKGDNVIVSSPNYMNADRCFVDCGANLLKVQTDKNGIIVEQIASLCKKRKIKCLYLTPHHHDPTTVTLSIERRIKILRLAEQYGFAIIEDDYDYDFHYQNRPVMPLASSDKTGHVIYIGSFAKSLSHHCKVGFVIAPGPFIRDLAKFRDRFDRPGDAVLEQSVGTLMKDGTLATYLKKAVNTYRERRDVTFELFKSELSNYMYCDLPSGGLAFWAIFEDRISLEEVSKKCREYHLYFPDGKFYNGAKNGCRLGFASMNIIEMRQAVEILKRAIATASTRS